MPREHDRKLGAGALDQLDQAFDTNGIMEWPMPSVVLRLRLCALSRQPKAASSRSCAATPSGCADAAREVFPSQRHFQPSDLAFGAFDHLFPPNQMIWANHTLPPEDNSLRYSVHATGSISIQSVVEAVSAPWYWLSLITNQKALPQIGPFVLRARRTESVIQKRK
jgi:hypothetical protein